MNVCTLHPGEALKDNLVQKKNDFITYSIYYYRYLSLLNKKNVYKGEG